jgi:DNA-binding NarL/FixJ family response regulator
MTLVQSGSAQVVILLVEDHPLFLDGMRRYLNEVAESYELVVAESALEAHRVVSSRDDLDIALIDLGLPDASGFELLERMREKLPAMPIVILSGSTSNSDIRRAFHAGARGYITKDTRPDIMLSALRLVITGGTYVPPQLVDGSPEPGPLQQTDEFSIAQRRIRRLTERQQEVLRLIVAERSNKDIANEIGCSHATVKVHVTAVLKTLGVPNRTGAAAMARQFGLSDGAAG